MPQTPSTRWCPTPEQLMILEEMYRSGVRTPNASHIQQITAHLSLYGKIEGKNVFYWFQNHKARDRQKLRRRLSRQYHLLHHGFTGHLTTTTNPPPSTLSTTSQLNYHHFLHQQQGYCSQVEATTQGMNLLCQLDNADGPSSSSSSSSCVSCEWMDYNPCCRPITTLDLFPTTTTGLNDDEYRTSKYSTSIN